MMAGGRRTLQRSMGIATRCGCCTNWCQRPCRQLPMMAGGRRTLQRTVGIATRCSCCTNWCQKPFEQLTIVANVWLSLQGQHQIFGAMDNYFPRDYIGTQTKANQEGNQLQNRNENNICHLNSRFSQELPFMMQTNWPQTLGIHKECAPSPLIA